jgi:hypothetical protein
MVRRDYLILSLITLAGGFLRFNNLGMNPLWIDEAFFAIMVKNGVWKQEFIPHLLTLLFNPKTELGLRLFSAIAGTLSIPAIYFVLKKYKWFAVCFIAFSPIHIFWSQMARPYALAGLFMIIGWRYWWAYFPALLTTPISLIGVRVLNQKKWFLILLAGLAIGFYFIRPDVGRQAFTDTDFILISTRWFYLILISLLLYSCDYFLPYLERVKHLSKAYPVILIAMGLVSLSGISDILSNRNEMLWYRQECKISDWRNIGDVNYATEVDNAEYYSGNKVGYFQHWEHKKIDSLLRAGDTLRVGMGQLAIGVCYPFISRYMGQANLNKYAQYLYEGNTLRVDLWRDKKAFYHRVIKTL